MENRGRSSNVLTPEIILVPGTNDSISQIK